MKDKLRLLFAPILRGFESGDTPYNYQPSHRTILVVMGILFTALALGVLVLVINSGQFGYFLPVLVFAGAGLVSLVVGGLGSDRAVAKIWNAGR